MNDTPFLRDVGGFAVRTGVVFALMGILLLALAKHVWLYDEQTQRTMLLTTLVLLGVTVLQRVFSVRGEPPLAADRRLRWLSLIVFPAYAIAMYWPFSSSFFHLTMFNAVQWLQVSVIVLATSVATLIADRLFLPLSREGS